MFMLLSSHVSNLHNKDYTGYTGNNTNNTRLFLKNKNKKDRESLDTIPYMLFELLSNQSSNLHNKKEYEGNNKQH